MAARGRLVKAAGQLACAAALAGTAGAAELRADGARVVEVTVYADRAEVVREAVVDVPAGASRVVFGALPAALDPDSIQAEARGVPAEIGAVRVTQEAREPEETPELVAARKEVRRIEAELQAISAEHGVAQRLEKFLGSIEATTATRVSRELGEGFTDPSSIRAVFDLLESAHGRLAREELERREQTRALNEQLAVAKARLDAVRPRGPIRFRVATLEVEAARAGRLTVRLTTLVPGASWRPSYLARLDADASRVEWVAEAVVQQTSGEDWTDVALTLSTAAPARGVAPPVLRPWYLRPLEPRAETERGRDTVMKMEGAKEQMIMNAEPAAGFGGEADAVRRTAAITRSAYNVAFRVPGRAEIPADGAEHRVLLRTDTLDAELAYKTVPSVREAAYLVATSTSPAGYPLLGGAVRVFAGSAFLGEHAVQETGPGSELELPFGVDNRVAVKRVRLPQERTKEGFTGRDRQVVFAYRTSVENLRDRPVEIVLEDRVPRSEDERIRVRIEDETTGGYTEDRDRPGVLAWTLTVPPGAKREVTLVYSVRHPRDLVVPGI